MNIYLWFLIITTALLLLFTAFNVFYGEYDGETQAYAIVVLLALQIAFYIVFVYVVAIIWIVDSINNRHFNRLNFNIVMGLFLLISSIFGSSLFGGSNIHNYYNSEKQKTNSLFND